MTIDEDANAVYGAEISDNSSVGDETTEGEKTQPPQVSNEVLIINSMAKCQILMIIPLMTMTGSETCNNTQLHLV